MNEHGTQNAIIELLRWKGHIVTRTFVGTIQNAATGSWVRGCDVGTPDLITHTKDGNILYIECKSMTGKLSMEQIRFLRNVQKSGLRWVVARSVEDVERALTDSAYHGSPDVVKPVLDEGGTFIPSQVHTKGKKTRMSFSTITEYNRFFKNIPKDVTSTKPPF